jgi:kynurenine 3-monooxygenase
MNAGLEDVRVLFDLLDEQSISPSLSSSSPQPPSSSALSPSTRHNYSSHRALALSRYSHQRAPDAAAINYLAIQNYTEMRSSVISPLYLLRKRLEELLSAYIPSLGWQTKYARVSFGNDRYSEVVRRSDRQGRVLVRGLTIALALLGGGLGVLGARMVRRWWWLRGRR